MKLHFVGYILTAVLSFYGDIYDMRFALTSVFILFLSSCGTAQGVMNGVGEVLTGMAVDARSVGSLFN